ncbi:MULTISPECIES: glucose-6-phosphate dehydrogenase assembly protein OpcA [Actinomycetes]|uniref:Glucose-6-phosphate dehydrogenase assembly protein OpcA n=2 Tax=Actinomycetes TaxID=1760 RepID=A0ABP6LTE7_9MICC|nr:MULTISPECIES: glucose-6-phosphate dehydrogenase assembly protein OpcA [unclassified Nesterenkonia]MDS2171673.1 glucose-6-phosphate dehydrogenase assembly protein OpcA [Nesterenkonia sp. CL21]OSM44729.1 OpcA protein [Nesterenkonia sp. PF2B19]
MIVDIPDTTTSKVSKQLNQMREAGGVVALTRVLTLVILASEENAEPAIAAANLASREHPCRIIVLATGDAAGDTRLDAQIRVGGDAGASEVIVLRASGELAEQNESMVAALLLPDAPIVAWWADEIPEDVSRTPIGRIAHRRITDTARASRPLEALHTVARSYHDGDSDLAWTRITGWRIQLASILDTMDPEHVTGATVEAAPELPSSALLAAWLQLALGVPVTLTRHTVDRGLSAVRLHTPDGDVVLSRPVGDIASLHLQDAPVQRVPLPHRTLEDCLSEEMRRLDADEVFGEVLTRGLPETDLRACVEQSAI